MQYPTYNKAIETKNAYHPKILYIVDPT